MTATTSCEIKDQVCRIRIEINGTRIVDTLTCGFVNIGRRVSGLPALVCAYDYDVIRQLLEDRIVQIIALREVAKSKRYKFDELEIKEWQQLNKLRPDIVLEATRLESNSKFLNQFESEIRTWSDSYMWFVTPEAIHTMLNNSFDIFLNVVTDQGSERIRRKLGIKGRKAKARQRVAVNLALDFVSKLSGIGRGRTKGIKSLRNASHIRGCAKRFAN